MSLWKVNPARKERPRRREEISVEREWDLVTCRKADNRETV